MGVLIHCYKWCDLGHTNGRFSVASSVSMKPPLPASVSVPVHEILHLRRALERLEGIGETNSPTIENLKRTVRLHIAELEAILETGQRASA